MQNTFSQPDMVSEIITRSETFFISLSIIMVCLLIALGIIYLLILFYRNRNREERSLDFVLMQVAVPKDNEIKIDAAEQMFASLYSFHQDWWRAILSPQEHISFEISAKPEDIRFYVSCPMRLKDLVEKQIHGAYPGAEIKIVDEYNIFSEKGKVAFGSLKSTGPGYFPIKVYKDLATDPLSSITAALAKMTPGEGAAIQILISPANNKWRAAGRRYISTVKKREADPEKAKYNVDPKTLELIENKCSKPGFNTVIRIVVSSTTSEMAKMQLDNIKSAFSQFTSDVNGFESERHFIKKPFMIDFIYRYMPVFGKRMIFNSEELATIFHFPNKSVETPNIYWLIAKRAPAPALIPETGLYLGKSIYRGLSKSICLSDEDRRRHMYIIGKTGVGKSELLKKMIMQDIRNGKGVCFVDPHDTVDKILEQIPPERAEDVIVFDPSDLTRPMGLNMLEADTEEQKHLIVTSIVGLMYKLYDPMKTGIIGPRFEHAIRNAMLTVMAVKGNTFIEVVRVLTDSNYVQELLPKVEDPMVRRYWTDQIAQTADFHKSEVLDYIVSKFGRFVTNKTIRNIIGQSESSFNFRKVMDEGKILIISLAKGKIGEENSNFLGLILVPRILTAAMSRQDVPESERRDFFLYVDEFQNFATPDFAQILSEARKYHLNLTVANQFIGQMDEEVKNAVFGNVGTLVSFRVGVTDANYLQHEFAPTFNEADLINIEARSAYIKTIVANEPVPAFSMDTTEDLSKEPRNPKVADMIRQLSRLKYGRDVGLVEQELQQRSNL
jgi:hypothetical protein